MNQITTAHNDAGAGGFDVYRKILWRIMPLIVFCYLCAYLDRVNVGFAKLQMMSDLHFSDAIYGFGAGIFFIGYFIFELPSNLMVHKVGARIWISRIMITWSVISAATLLVQTPAQFYMARFMLGIAEAGFSPGIMLYLTYWFPSRKRGLALGFYYLAIPLAGGAGGMLSGWLLENFAESNVMRGWQWLFLVEAIPSFLAGIAVLFLMVDKPEQAPWLTSEEKRKVTEEILHEDSTKVNNETLFAFLRDRRLWKLCLVYFCQIIGLYGVSFWLPSIVSGSGATGTITIGWLSAIPYLVAIPCIVISGITVDRHRSRRMHFSVAMVIGALGLAVSGYNDKDLTLAVMGLSVGTAGTLSALSLFWGIPPSFLAGQSAAVGIAAINCVGNLAGFISPYMVGWFSDTTGAIKIGLFAVASFMLLGAILMYTLPAKFADQ